MFSFLKHRRSMYLSFMSPMYSGTEWKQNCISMEDCHDTLSFFLFYCTFSMFRRSRFSTVFPWPSLFTNCSRT